MIVRTNLTQCFCICPPDPNFFEEQGQFKKVKKAGRNRPLPPFFRRPWCLILVENKNIASLIFFCNLCQFLAGFFHRSQRVKVGFRIWECSCFRSCTDFSSNNFLSNDISSTTFRPTGFQLGLRVRLRVRVRVRVPLTRLLFFEIGPRVVGQKKIGQKDVDEVSLNEKTTHRFGLLKSVYCCKKN